MDMQDLFKRAIDQTSGIVANVKPDQLEDATPCTEFTVKQLVSHTIGALKMFEVGGKGDQLDMAVFGQDLAGDDPSANYEKHAAATKAVWSEAGVLERTTNMPFGAVPGSMAITIGIVELAQHGWDIARATRQGANFDPELTEAAIGIAKQMPAEMVRQPGVFGPEVECSPDAAASERLAAFLGRAV